MNTDVTPRWKQALRSVLQPTRAKEQRDSELNAAMRALCHQLIADLPLPAKLEISARIETATRRKDLMSLRACVFDAISMQHGERIARERLGQLDSRWP